MGARNQTEVSANISLTNEQLRLFCSGQIYTFSALIPFLKHQCTKRDTLGRGTLAAISQRRFSDRNQALYGSPQC